MRLPVKLSKLLSVLLTGFTLSLLGCANVQPWERGTLAKPQMALDAYPLQSSMRAHNYGSREAGASSAAGQGGGCGCN
jgi:hypothetical protein